MSDIDPLQLLTADLQSNDYETIVQSINQLITVAIALGPERVRTQLLPVLSESAGLSTGQSTNQHLSQPFDIENDEAQTAIARQLAFFTPLIGGSQYLHLLLPLFEKYCGEEEYVVRNTAVQSLNKLIPLFPKADLTAKFIPILKRLSNGDWFTTRVSACGLFSVTYQSINQTTDQSISQSVKESILSELRSLFYNLCNDDTPMVRKAAFVALPDYAQALQSTNRAANQSSNQYFKSDVLPIVKAISIDDMDVMRVHAVDVVASLLHQSVNRTAGQSITPTTNPSIEDAADLLNNLMPVIDALADDQSWRVRASLAKNFSKISSSARLIDTTLDQSTNQPVNQSNNRIKAMFTLFIRLLKDREGEVRSAAAEQLDSVIGVLVSDQVYNHFTEQSSHQLTSQSINPSVNHALARELIETASSVLESLTTDPQQNVRMSLSKSLISVCGYFKQSNQPINQPTNPSSEVVLNMLIPRLHVLARDESYEVRHSALLHMESLLRVIGITNVSNLVVPVLQEASKDVKWRVRYSCLHACHVLAYHMGASAFEKRLLPCLISALSDHVYGVRQLACRQLGLVSSLEQLAPGSDADAGTFGPRWAAERMFPLAFVLFDKTTNYRHRMTVLLLIEQVVACYTRPQAATMNVRDIDEEIVHTHETSLIDLVKTPTNPPTPQPNSEASEQQFALLIEQHISPIILQACNDAVANVRVAACKTLTILAETGKVNTRALLTRFQGHLTKLSCDTDTDTSFFAHVALRALEKE